MQTKTARGTKSRALFEYGSFRCAFRTPYLERPRGLRARSGEVSVGACERYGVWKVLGRTSVREVKIPNLTKCALFG